VPVKRPSDDLIREILVSLPDDATARRRVRAPVAFPTPAAGAAPAGRDAGPSAARAPARDAAQPAAPPASHPASCMPAEPARRRIPSATEMALVPFVTCGLYSFPFRGFFATNAVKRRAARSIAPKRSASQARPVIAAASRTRNARQGRRREIAEASAATKRAEGASRSSARRKRTEADAWSTFHCDDDDHYPELARAARWRPPKPAPRSDARLARECYEARAAELREHAAGDLRCRLPRRMLATSSAA